MASGDLTATRGNYSDYNCNYFDGVDDYVSIPHNTGQLGANLAAGLTISAWVNAETVGEGGAGEAGRILDKTTDSANGTAGFEVGARTLNSTFQIMLNGAGAKTIGANNALVVKTWTHVLFTISPTAKGNIFVNGVLSGTADQSMTGVIADITTTNAMRIGNSASATDRTFDGAIREVKMWGRVLTAAEIAKDYAGGDIVKSGLLHYFKLGGDYKDYGNSGGADATNSGSLDVTSGVNSAVVDVSQINIAAASSMEFLQVVNKNLSKQPIIIGVNRAA